MVLGAALLLAALSLFLFNQREAWKAENYSEEILAQVIENIDIISSHTDTGSFGGYGNMNEIQVDGIDYIGYLSIPSLGLQLPVASQWSYERLKIVPCRYAGSAMTDDLVIAAHNYPRHFGTLSKLSPGDEVYFIDGHNVAYDYEVMEVDILAATAVEEMTSGDYDLTLFTCTYGGKSRVTVRCEKKDGSEE